MSIMASDSKRPRRIVLWLAALIVVVGLPVGYVLWTERNTAHDQSEFIVEFAESHDLVVYCGNGAGLGLLSANEHPWWEWTLLDRTDPSELAAELETELSGRGFEIQEALIEGRTTVSIEGRHDSGLTVNAQIAAEMPPTNCFPKYDDVITDVEPSDYETAAVVMFRDESRSR